MLIKLPRWFRQPAWLTRWLDVYSDWAAVETGPNLRVGAWRYRVKRMDWVSITHMLVLGTAVGGWYWAFGGEFWKGFVIAQVMGVVAWIWLEYIVPRDQT